ncbi:hypothetical protein BJ508DRAFT_335792 [Ascobolus immersus RN42]|uniref:Uncharacterized protein n=1 Tax=Ascobolus immersus RN42 TaxID=1160509 RepID=A0A3N4HB41_ASCIM|nr:hypothetical protein BJ508DRAFT_335792 [Ascobolus immersus RN42]
MSAQSLPAPADESAPSTKAEAVATIKKLNERILELEAEVKEAQKDKLSLELFELAKGFTDRIVLALNQKKSGFAWESDYGFRTHGAMMKVLSNESNQLGAVCNISELTTQELVLKLNDFPNYAILFRTLEALGITTRVFFAVVGLTEVRHKVGHPKDGITKAAWTPAVHRFIETLQAFPPKETKLITCDFVQNLKELAETDPSWINEKAQAATVKKDYLARVARTVWARPLPEASAAKKTGISPSAKDLISGLASKLGEGRGFGRGGRLVEEEKPRFEGGRGRGSGRSG